MIYKKKKSSDTDRNTNALLLQEGQVKYFLFALSSRRKAYSHFYCRSNNLVSFQTRDTYRRLFVNVVKRSRKQSVLDSDLSLCPTGDDQLGLRLHAQERFFMVRIGLYLFLHLLFSPFVII